MKLKVLFVFLVILLSAPLFAQYGAVNGYCNLGATQIVHQGLKSTNYAQGEVPSCTVTVYLTGTSTLATIYSNTTGTPLSNPFTASPKGKWDFFASSILGFDVVLSGGIFPNNYPSPVTISGVSSSIFPLLPLPIAYGGTGQTTGIAALNALGAASGSTPIVFGNPFVAPTVTASVNGTVNVKASPYNATGNGVTDDTAAINSAITYAIENGGTVYFPPGIYLFSGLSITAVTSIKLEGANMTADSTSPYAIGTELLYSGTGTAINVAATGGAANYRFEMSDIRLAAKTYNSASIGLSLNNTQETYLDHVAISDGYSGFQGFGTGIQCEGCNLAWFDHMILAGNGIGLNCEYGTGAAVGCSSIRITESNIANNSVAHLKLGNVSGMSVSDSYLEGSPAAFLINDTTPFGNAVVQNVNVTNTHILQSSAYSFFEAQCLQLTSASSTAYIQVGNFNIDHSECYAIYPSGSNPVAPITFTTNGHTRATFTGSIEHSYFIGGTTAAVSSDSGTITINSKWNTFYRWDLGILLPFITGTASSFDLEQEPGLSGETLTGSLTTTGPVAVGGTLSIPNNTALSGENSTDTGLEEMLYVGPTNVVTAPSPTFVDNKLQLLSEGQCAMTSGTCSAQALGTTYTAAFCVGGWTGTGTLTGQLKFPSTSTTVTPASSVNTDTAVVSYACFGY